ncbi:hypothetical protein [Megalodesulfovibrio paquesii]
MMKKMCMSTVMTLCISMLTIGVAMAKEVVVMNGCSFELHGLALSPSESNNWGDDLLGNDILKPGEGVRINIQGDANNWDMAVVDDDGTQLEFTNLDLRKVNKVTLRNDGTADLE